MPYLSEWSITVLLLNLANSVVNFNISIQCQMSIYLFSMPLVLDIARLEFIWSSSSHTPTFSKSSFPNYHPANQTVLPGEAVSCTSSDLVYCCSWCGGLSNGETKHRLGEHVIKSTSIQFTRIILSFLLSATLILLLISTLTYWSVASYAWGTAPSGQAVGF